VTPLRASAHRRRLVRAGRRAAGLGVVAVLTVVLAQSTTTAAFTAATGDTGNRVTAAGSFCASASSRTVNVSEDTSVYQSSTGANTGDSTSLTVVSATSAQTWSLVRFNPMPSIPTGCELVSATLSLYAIGPQVGRFIEVSRADPATPWTELGVNWATRPQPAGTPAPSPSLTLAGLQTWNVTSLMPALYAGTNNGFLVRDQTDNANPAKSQAYVSSEGTATQVPTLTVSWG
jgi:hypothetical protein